MNKIINEISNVSDINELKKIQEQVNNKIEFLEDDGLYWHYTSFDALQSILSSNNPYGPTIRATNIHFLNDKSEFSHGEKILQQNGYEIFEGSEDIYSFSLSKARDSLYQWLQYSPKENGVAIGFKLDGDTEDTNSSFYYPYHYDSEKKSIHAYFTHLAECIYMKNGEKITEEHMAPLEKIYRKIFQGHLPDDVLDKFAQVQAKAGISTLLPFFIKHPAFKDEREIRILFNQINEHTTSEYKFDIQYTNKKPFVNLSFKANLISKLHLSPRGDIELMEKLVMHFMKTNTYLSHLDPSKDLLRSSIPFRD